ncbi:MFS transporter [Streptomyces shenzhenensis]|uniref:MFS transporter n=1 Tax=Streptomyces shenzhenensis TaxID=943815 RepID=UPI0037F75B65
MYSGMNLAKTAWPLYYLEAKHGLNLLAACYTAMAVTGVIGSAVTGWLVDRIGVAAVLSAGSVNYGAGLLLRLQHVSLLLAALNGVIMGVGASALISCLRPWMVTDEGIRPQVISYRTATLNIGMAADAALLTPILLLSHDQSFGYVLGLAVPAALVILIAPLRPAACADLRSPRAAEGLNRTTHCHDQRGGHPGCARRAGA